MMAFEILVLYLCSVSTEAEFMNVHCTMSLKFLGIILRLFRLEVSDKMITFQTSFRPLLLGGGGGGYIH
jgi:hypothetical protein